MVRGLFIALFLMVGLSGFAQFSQWRGGARDGQYFDRGLLKEWPEDGPVLLWTFNGLGKGHSSPAIGEDRLYISGKFEDKESLIALDDQGNKLWVTEYGRAWNKSYPDARTTPTLVDGKVYLISGMGEVACLDAESGELLWFRDAYKEFGGVCNLYGISEAPLVIDNKVLFTPGGSKTSMIALDKENGQLIWKSESIPDSAAYVSPLLIRHANQDMVISLMANWAFGLDPTDGKILWKFNYINLDTRQSNPYMIRTNCNTPLYHDGEIMLNKGYDHPTIKLRLNKEGTAVDLVWSSFDFDTHTGGYVLVDGYLYGSNWINNGMGNWLCVDWQTGETMWEEKWNNKGSVIYADGLLYFYEEKRGNIALVKPNPEKMEIISSFQISEGSGPHWSHPVIHNGILYVRHGDALQAYSLKAK